MFSPLSTGCGPLSGLPKSVFSLGNGLSSVEAWFSTALDIEEVLSGVGGDQLHIMVADVIKSFDIVDSSFLTVLWVDFSFPTGFGRHTLLITVRFVSGSSWLLAWANHGVGMGLFLRFVLSVWCSLLLCVCLGAVILRLCLM